MSIKDGLILISYLHNLSDRLIICFDEKDSGRPISVGAAKTYKTNFFPKSYPSIEVKIKLSLSLKSKIH